MNIDDILNKDVKDLTSEDLQAVKDALKSKAADRGDDKGAKKIEDTTLSELKEEIYKLQRDIAGIKPVTKEPEKKSLIQSFVKWLEN